MSALTQMIHLIWQFVIMYLFLENIADSNLAFDTADPVYELPCCDEDTSLLDVRLDDVHV